MAHSFQEPAGSRMRESESAGLLIAAASLLLAFGCAAPGAPVTRQPTVPRAITDLSAKQAGNTIVLSFTLPTQTIQGKALSKPPAIEVYRKFGSVPAAGARAGSEQAQLVTTIPPQMVDHYQKAGRVEFPDVLALADLTAHTGADAVYMVRTRTGKHSSEDSNAVQLLILPSPQPIHDLHAQITKAGVYLSWTAPNILPKDSPPPISLRYRVYRADISAQGNLSAASSGHTEPVLLDESTVPFYADSDLTFGHTYAYSVRAVAKYTNASVRSADSNVLNVTPEDTFAPSTPQSVAATAGSASNTGAAHIDLSWAINGESDLLGYNIYRSEMKSIPGARVNATPLITPAFRDNSVVPGKQYFYSITAVDRTGNESAPSPPVAVTVPISNDQDQHEKPVRIPYETLPLSSKGN